MMDRIEAYWQRFLKDTGADRGLRYEKAYHFDLTPEAADELMTLVLAGPKRATCSSAACFAAEGVRPPQVGDLCILTDGSGTPRCVVRTTAVACLPFEQVTEDMALREGEDDSLQSWRDNHVRFFTREGARLGYAFAPGMPVYFEDFDVVYRQGARVRPMGPEDYGAVYRLWKQTPGIGVRRLDDAREGFERFLRRNPTTNFVAEDEGELVGCIQCGHDGRRGTLYHAVVLPERRGQGVGKALMAAALDALQAEGIHKANLVVFRTNETGNAFWRSQGWVQRSDLNYFSKVINPDNQ